MSCVICDAKCTAICKFHHGLGYVCKMHLFNIKPKLDSDVVENCCSSCVLDFDESQIVTMIGHKVLSHVEVPAYKEMKKLLQTLSDEDKKLLEWDDFNFAARQNSADTCGSELANNHANKALETLKEDIANIDNKKQEIKQKNEFLQKGVTIPKLLARYEKLSLPWRSYVVGKLQFDDVSDSKETERDAKLFELFGKIANIQDKDELFQVMNTFDKILLEVENVSI